MTRREIREEIFKLLFEKELTDNNVEKRIEEINNIPDIYERAIDYFCYSVRGQLFWDGNKRTSTIVASKILISEGKGVLTIGKKEALSFNEALLHFYDTADSRLLKECLMGCIKGENGGL